MLGVTEQASHADLRRALRRRLRETHPDTGGTAAEFHLVQWAWELVGTPEARAAYDSGARRSESTPTWAPPAPRRRADSSRPPARTHGHPGGWFRERYLELLGEWVGRGAAIPDPYDPALVRSAPVEVRHLLASAIAEERTAVALASLGIAFTVWNDVVGDESRGGFGKLDHVVLGPTGLWGMLSEDWGAEVAVRRGELIGPGIHRDERPVQDLARRTRAFEKRAKARFSGLVIVVPDDASAEGVLDIGKVRSARASLVQHSRVAHFVRTGIPGVGVGGTDLFEVRTRVQGAARFV